MIEVFRRPEKGEDYCKLLDESISKMRQLLKMQTEFKADKEQVERFIISLIEEQDESGFWGLIPSPHVDSDIRVLYWYTPTYIATALLMDFYLNNKSDAAKIACFEDALRKGLEASTGRGLKGHGVDDICGLLDALEILHYGRVMTFLKTYPMYNPKFTDMINKIISGLNNAIKEGKTRGTWGEDYRTQMQNILQLLSEEDAIKVFVYGTLMKGRANHGCYLANAKIIGNATVEGFALYDLGSYPAVVYSQGDKIKGELYKIDTKILSRLDVLEGEGSLYSRRSTNVVLENSFSHNAYIYVYNHSVNGNEKVELIDQPWGKKDMKEYVWYASYGSNMLYERFMLYIKGGNCRFNNKHYDGCNDKDSPKADRPVEIPYRMYFGNRSGSWFDGGVSFLDLNSPGRSLGRMYLITKEQFEDVHNQESPGSGWYNKVCDLGEFEGHRIVTITNSQLRPTNAPSDAYLDVVKSGIKETYPEMSDYEIMKYLANA